MAPQYSLCQFSVSWRHNILYISFPVKYFLFDSSQVKRSLTCSIKNVVKKKKKIMTLFYGWGSTVSKLQMSHYGETVYFLPRITQEFLAVIWSTSEGWKAELTLEPPSGFEPVTPCAFLLVEAISSSGSHCFY